MYNGGVYMIKAILFDSGKVLDKPVSGHWFIPPNFFEYVDREKYESVPSSNKRAAFTRAGNYISKKKFVVNSDEEYSNFVEYYRILGEEIPRLKLKDSDAKAIARDLVYNYDKYTFYKDAANLIPELSKKYKLAVVTDAWPSLENVFKKAGFRDYFSSFIISSMIGVTKPNELMYKAALSELNVLPEEALFIDDHAKNCEGASKLGIKSIILSREFKFYIYNKLVNTNYQVIRSLNELNDTIYNEASHTRD